MSKHDFLTEQDFLNLKNKQVQKAEIEQREEKNSLIAQAMMKSTLEQFLQYAKDYPSTAVKCGIKPRVYPLNRKSIFKKTSEPLFYLNSGTFKIEVKSASIMVSAQGKLFSVINHNGNSADYSSPAGYIVKPFIMDDAIKELNKFKGTGSKTYYAERGGFFLLINVIAGLCYHRSSYDGTTTWGEPLTENEITANIKAHFKWLVGL